MMNEITKNTRLSYDRMADEYVRRIYSELQHKPVDRQLLDRFAVRVTGSVCDLSCGPGHVARYLHEHGVEVCGIDLSPGLVERALQLNPGVDFQLGNMYALDAADATWAGIVAFYSIIHVPRTDHVAVLSEISRVLRPGGLLLLTFHIGDEVVHLDELWGQAVSLDFYFFRTEEVADALRSAGFEVEEIIERDPYPDVEAQTRRGYVLASKRQLKTDENGQAIT
ncbi:MAG: class I SAM-dependent methyltransferase [Chthoniobacterales bacterium]